jgi:site-specific recombinase XerD
MEKSFGLLFFLRKSKSTADGELHVYLKITVDRTAVEISTKRKCHTEKWNNASGRMKGKTDAVREFNAYLDTLTQKVFEAKRQLIESDKPVTAQSIKDLLLGTETQRRKVMLMEMFQQHNEKMKALVGHQYAPMTLKRYETALRHTRAFIQWKFKVPDIPIQSMDYEMICDFEFWFKSVRKCDHNTTMKYLSNFRKIVNHCLKSGWLPKDPFYGFNMGKREVRRFALTEHELQKIESKEIQIERLSIVRDIFLFSCYTGLAYVDVKQLKASEIIVGIDGEEWIVSQRQKTAVPTRIPLLPNARAIINRYQHHPQRKLNDQVLPILTNQKMNAYLKEIADICGISTHLTFHIARHTFATTVTLNNGVPIETVSKMLGHRDIKTTQQYAKILDRKVSDDMKSIRKKYLPT